MVGMPQEGLEDIGSAVGGFGSNVGRVTGSMWGSVRSGFGRAAAAVHVAKADGSQGGEGAAMPDASQEAADVSNCVGCTDRLVQWLTVCLLTIHAGCHQAYITLGKLCHKHEASSWDPNNSTVNKLDVCIVRRRCMPGRTSLGLPSGG
jgi:hypothetical protein